MIYGSNLKRNFLGETHQQTKLREISTGMALM